MKINWYRVWVIIEKEWTELQKNKMILAMVALMPIILALTLVGVDYLMIHIDEAEVNTDESLIPQHLQHLDPIEAQVIQINEQLMLIFLLVPMTLPSFVAAHAIIGEKQAGTLEPVLATPIATWELLAGKGIAAASPAVMLTWISYAAAMVGLKLIASPTVFAYTANPVWILAIGLLSPLLALLSTLCGIVISSRTNDPRTAQQATAVFVMPFIVGSVALFVGWILVNVLVVLLAVLVALLVNLTVIYFAVKLFQRETILTRWK